MPHEVVDETNGPGRSLTGGIPERTQSVIDRMLGEIWVALGHPNDRTPTLDEVLLDIRRLVQFYEDTIQQDEHERVRHADITPLLMEEEDETGSSWTVTQPSVTYGPFGMSITGYSVDDVLRIRAAEVTDS